MAKYETRALSVGDFTVTVSKAGKTGAERVVALLEKIAEAIVDPGYGVGAGNRPDQGLPGQPGHPDQGLPPSAGSPDNTLPETPSHKPGSPAGGPDQSLPGEELADFLKENAEEIAKAVLKGTLCDPEAQPKR